jgi:membrane-bound lytic murein transglycosylase D
LKRVHGIPFLIGLLLIFSACSTSSLLTPSTPPAAPAAVIEPGAEGNPPHIVDLEENIYQTDSKTGAAASVDENGEGEALAGAASDQGGTDKSPQTKFDEALEFCRTSQDFWQRGELEKAIEALDQAYALILSIETLDDSALVQEKEDLRFMISKRILEIYASRNIVVNGNHNAIPLDLNRHVQAEIQRFMGPERDYFIQSLKLSGRYRPYIVSALAEAGLPQELSWLPLIESGFKVKALSSARALGLWQFIPSTGYKFGLKRDRFIDERMDPEKSTLAAIAYLRELHNIFGDWTTVLAAYNCGEGRVLRVIKTQNVNYLDNFWDLYERLPRETARYVPRFLATLHIISNPEKYGFDMGIVDAPLEYDTVAINKQILLKDTAQALQVDAADLLILNPELRYQLLPPESYDLKVPSGMGETLLTQIDRIPQSNLPQPAFVYHRVRPGETLSTIARKYRTSVGRIMRANHLRSSHYIVAGKRLKIPQSGYVYRESAPPPPRAQSVAPDRPSQHVVRRGDSLWNIARQYGTTTEAIQALNGLNGTNLHKGQVLRLPGTEASPTASGTDGLKTYQVKTGDSPFKIAQSHDMSLERFMAINQLSSRSRIYPGQQLYVE